MRILYVTNSSQIGGGNRSLLTLWGGLQEKGVTALAVCPSHGPMVAACEELGVPCVVRDYRQPSWRTPLASWAAYSGWQQLLHSLSVDLVHANDITVARMITLTTWRMRLPLLCHVRFPPTFEDVQWAFQYVPKPDVFIFNSQALSNEISPYITEFCKFSEQRVIYNGVDIDQFSERYKKDGDKIIVGIIANIIPVKGHLDFIEMAYELQSRRITAEYWIIGEDIHHSGYKHVLEERIRELGVESCVHFLGYCSNVAELLNRLDVVVLSSHVEPFGRNLIEAMACKRPVVATRVGGIPEVVEDGVTGILVPPHAPTALANALERLFVQPELRRQMGEAGRERVERLFSQEAHVENIVTLYQQAITRVRRP